VITDAVLSFFTGLVSTVFGWMPTITPPSLGSDLSGLGTVWQYFSWANQFLPLDIALACAGLLLAAWGTRWLVMAALWVATKAHVLGGSSN
jgi:carbon starvation protein CstA